MSEVSQVIGLVGAGTMGSRMVAALREGDVQVAVWDVSEAARDAAAQLGATVCSSSAEVASLAEVVLLSLPGPTEVRQVTACADGLLDGDPLPSHIVDLSTVDPATSRELAELTESRGVHFVDAPVLGRPMSCGKWTIPAGGAREAVAAVEQVLRHFALRVVPVGPTGSGSALKLLNNLMFGAINAITCECMVGAARVGLDAATFFETVLESNAATVSNLFKELGPKILAADWAPTFTLSLLEKDNRLGVEMLKAAGLDATVSQVVADLNRRAISEGLGANDTSGLAKVVGLTNRTVGMR